MIFPCGAPQTLQSSTIHYLEFAEKVPASLPLVSSLASTNVEAQDNPYDPTDDFDTSRKGRKPHIVYKGTIESIRVRPLPTLRPFFNRVMEDSSGWPDNDSPNLGSKTPSRDPIV